MNQKTKERKENPEKVKEINAKLRTKGFINLYHENPERFFELCAANPIFKKKIYEEILLPELGAKKKEGDAMITIIQNFRQLWKTKIKPKSLAEFYFSFFRIKF